MSSGNSSIFRRLHSQETTTETGRPLAVDQAYSNATAVERHSRDRIQWLNSEIAHRTGRRTEALIADPVVRDIDSALEWCIDRSEELDYSTDAAADPGHPVIFVILGCVHIVNSAAVIPVEYVESITGDMIEDFGQRRERIRELFEERLDRQRRLQAARDRARQMARLRHYLDDYYWPLVHRLLLECYDNMINGVCYGHKG